MWIECSDWKWEAGEPLGEWTLLEQYETLGDYLEILDEEGVEYKELYSDDYCTVIIAYDPVSVEIFLIESDETGVYEYRVVEGIDQVKVIGDELLAMMIDAKFSWKEIYDVLQRLLDFIHPPKPHS